MKLEAVLTDFFPQKSQDWQVPAFPFHKVYARDCSTIMFPSAHLRDTSTLKYQSVSHVIST